MPANTVWAAVAPYLEKLHIGVPETLNGWIRRTQKCSSPCCFKLPGGTLKAFVEDPKRLGGQMGMMSVLHT